MSRLNTLNQSQATGTTKTLYSAIEEAMGIVPNIFKGFGNSPTALEGVLHTDALLKKGSLNGTEIETIKLAVSEAYGCTYCLAAHTLLGKKSGLSEADTIAVRRGNIAQPRLAALVKFVNDTLQPQARVSDAQLATIRAAGFNDAQIAEIVQAIAQTVYTNLFNRVHQTALDFPAAPAL